MMGSPIGKYTKYKFMKEHSVIAPHLPATALLTEQSFSDYLDRFGIVIVKPCRGYKGIGVVQIRLLNGTIIEIQSGLTKTVFESKGEAFSSLKKNHLFKKRRYIIQERIPLTTINGCPFDIRVLVQRKKNSYQWEVTGILVRVAAKGYFVTNYAKAVMTVEEALEKSGIRELDANKVVEKLNEVGLNSANILQEHYPAARRIGLDVGLTEDGHISILEANLGPDLAMFKFLKNKSVYEKIRKYRKG